MLSRIYIKNFALIDTLEVSLNNGLQVITGETGAGKSIILGALRLILGERADVKSISKAEEKSVVETEFALNNQFKKFLLKMIWIMSCKPSSEEKYCHPVNQERLSMMFR